MIDRIIKISDIGRDYKTCIYKEIQWSEFVKSFKNPKVGNETLEEYSKLPKDKRDKLKNVGGYVGGVFKDNTRKKENLLSRSLITLDLDNIEANTLENVYNNIDLIINSYLIHSSRKHSVEAPRLRLIIPLDRDVNAEEYEAIARKIGELIGFKLCDKTTFEPSRLMYYPSCCKGTKYVYKLKKGELLKADVILGMYDNWQDKNTWKGIDKDDIYKSQVAKQQDPLTKEGPVGEFCRAYYPIDEAIAELLSDVYSPCDIPNRYTYIKGSTTAGAVIYDDKFLYSHHQSDPAGGVSCNVFDLVRIHKFRHLDEDIDANTNIKDKPSFKAMVEFANTLDKVKKQRERDSYLKAVEEFSTPIAPLDSSTPFLANINKVKSAAREGFSIYIVETDKEASKLKELGYTATYISSLNDDTKVWQYSYSEFFKGSNVIIVQNNNDDSKNFVEDTKKKLKNYAHSIKVLSMETDLLDYLDKHSKGDFKDLVKEVPKTYAPWVFISDKGKISINEGLLASAISKSLTFISKPVGNKTLNYLYKNGVYNEVSKNELKKEISSYIPNNIIKNNWITNITELSILKNNNDNINLEGKDNIINFKNGLYNVETKKLKPHRKDYINLIQINANYEENPINRGYWDKFINDLTLGREELKLILQEWFGLVISNYNGALVKSIFILYGKGNTGKSKVINVLTSLLNGKNTKSIAIQNFKDRFSLSSLDYTRLIFNADLPTKIIEDSALALLKQLTGGDKINIEKKNVDCLDVTFRGLLMYGSNKLPSLSGDLGNWVFDRFLIFPCDNPIPEDKQDPKILDKLLKDKQYIIKWSLEGLERLINNNFKFSYSKIVEDVKEAYKTDTDSIRAFIKEKYIITGDKKDIIPAKILKEDYSCFWCPDNDIIPVTKNFKARMLNVSDAIEYKSSCRYKGKITSCYIGIKRVGEM